MVQKKNIESKLKTWKKISLILAISGLSIFVGSSGIRKITNPEVSKQYEIMSDDLYELKQQKKKLVKRVNVFSKYKTPLINELSKNFNQEIALYDNAILEMRQNMNEIRETPEFIKSQERYDKIYFPLQLGGYGFVILGLLGMYKYSGLERKYLKEK